MQTKSFFEQLPQTINLEARSDGWAWIIRFGDLEFDGFSGHYDRASARAEAEAFLELANKTPAVQAEIMEKYNAKRSNQ